MNKTLVSTLKTSINKQNNQIFWLSCFEFLSNKYSYESIKRTINSLVNDGYIKQVFRGFYYKPKYVKAIKKYLPPDYEALAYAIAQKQGWSISPTGTRSLNLLGLSNQVSQYYVFASTGPYKKYNFDGLKVVFKRTKSNELVNYSYYTKLLIQALKTLGKDNINQEIILKLRNNYSPIEKSTILNESRFTTRWIYQYIKEICL